MKKLIMLVLALLILSLSGCGNSSPTAPGGGTAPTVPAAPVAAATAGNAQNTITWPAILGATSYKIYVAINSAASTTAQIVAAGSTTPGAIASPYAHTGLANDTTSYSYVVTALNGIGESAPSNVVSASPTAAAAPAPTVTSFTPTSGAVGATVTINGTNFSATPASNAVTFAGGATTSVSAATTTSLTVTVPTGATSGPITVSVDGQAGTSAASFTVLISPATPTGVTASTNTNSNTIQWPGGTGATSYNIYWATNSTSSSSAEIQAGGTLIAGVASPYTHTGLTTNTKYSYVVTAVNAGGESAPSAVVSAMPNNIAIYGTIAGITGGIPAALAAAGYSSVQISVYDFDFVTPGIVTNATVTINGTPAALATSGVASGSYTNNMTITPGTVYTVNVTIPNDPNTYTSTGTMYSTYPVITAPAANFIWSAAAANTVTWTQGSPAVDSNGVIVFDTNNAAMVYSSNTPFLATTHTIPAGSMAVTPAASVIVTISQNVPVVNTGSSAGVTFLGGAAPINGAITP